MAEKPSRYPPVALPDLPYAKEVQAQCLAFPGAFEDYPWGDVVFKVGARMFAAVGDYDGVLGVTVKAAPDDAEVLVQLPNVERARYIGRYGWLTAMAPDAEAHAFVRDLIDASYALVAPKRGAKAAARGRR